MLTIIIVVRLNLGFMVLASSYPYVVRHCCFTVSFLPRLFLSHLCSTCFNTVLQVFFFFFFKAFHLGLIGLQESVKYCVKGRVRFYDLPSSLLVLSLFSYALALSP